MSVFERIFGNPNERELKRLNVAVEATNALEAATSSLTNDQIRERMLKLRDRLATGTSAEAILPEAFACVREAAKRTLQQRHFDVQIMGGIVLHEGRIAEMKTGEGKTLVATLPVSLNALTGKGVHVVTVNDYLAKRDVQWMGPVYHLLGFTVSCIQHEAAFQFDPDATSDDTPSRFLRPITRREAYAADITYGTNNEFGFDYLRDNMVPTLEHAVQRKLSFAIVDEVDSILIDEARTPLIISAPAEESNEQYTRYESLIRRLEESTDYNIDEKLRATTLTEAGIAKLETALGVENIYAAGGIETVHHIEQALKAHAIFKRDRDYVVKDGEVVIVDEFTGRLMFGRRYSEGLHQAIEAKEGVKIQQESQTFATITFQNYFRLYKKLAGMTGTAATEAEEFHKIYNLDVVVIPTNRPLIREDLTDSVYKTEQGKFIAVIREIKRRHDLGQPLLVGTISIEKNEILGELLRREGIPHEILNAKNHEKEASIIAQAGRKGSVTVATNMAGRGVDIILGGNPPNPEEADTVRRLGGLHVIGTERHEARRIDNQLRGRSGRQGDPGSSQFFVSMEDDLMRIFGSDRMKGLMDRLGLPEDTPIENRLVSRAIETAQKKVEGHNFDIRKHLVEYDDVINKHREVVYDQRRSILESVGKSEGVKPLVKKAIGGEIERLVTFHTASGNESDWNIEEIYESIDAMFSVGMDARLSLENIRKQKGETGSEPATRTAIIRYLTGLAEKEKENLEERIGDPTVVRNVERAVCLRTIDTLWVEHLDLMEHLREGIGLRGYGQRDPLVEYKKEAYRLFTELMENIQRDIANVIFKVSVSSPSAESPFANRPTSLSAPAKTADQYSGAAPSSSEKISSAVPGTTITAGGGVKTNTGQKIGRNDPCPCGSGKKYKKCHGK